MKIIVWGEGPRGRQVVASIRVSDYADERAATDAAYKAGDHFVELMKSFDMVATFSLEWI